MIKGTFLEPVAWWAYSAVAVTGLCGLVYISVQQEFRQNLDDPQISIAEDAARALANGAVPASVMPLVAGQAGARNPNVDLRQSLTPWIAIYDGSGLSLEASGQLNNAPPKLPAGTFDASTWLPRKTFVIDVGTENRFTWQAAADVRQAVVLVKLTNPKGSAAYVAVGRNMREIESRIADMGTKVLLAWAVILGALFASSVAGWLLLKNNKPHVV